MSIESLLRRAPLTTLGLALGLGLGSCSFLAYETVRGEGSKVSEQRDVSSFDRVAIAGSFEVDLRAGQAGALPEVLVDSHENLLPYIETEVRDRTLEVRVREGYRISPRPQVAIRLADLRGVEIAGSADIEATGLAGAAFSVEIAGSGNVRAQGQVDDVEVEIAGSGAVQLTNLQAREARVRIAGSGDVQLHAAERLDVSIAGSGDVRYSGDPQVSQHVAGSGDISPVR